MKKILTLCAGVLLVFGLCACNGGDTPDIPGPGEDNPDPEVTEPEPETGGEGGDTGEGGETQYVELELIKDEYTLTEGDDPVKLEYNVNPPEAKVDVTSDNENTAIVTQDEYDQWWITPVLAGYGDATLTVTASYAGWESDTRTATVTVQKAEEVSTVTGIKFAEDSYELTVGTPKEFVYGTDIIFEGTGTHSQDFVLSVEATYANVITIGEDGHTVTASEDVENVTLTVTATGADVVGEVTATTTISATGGTVAPEVTGVEFINDAGETTSEFTLTLTEGTLDLTNHVKVSGTGDYSHDFTIALTETNPSGCATLEGNVLTAVKEGTATVTVTASGKTATATVTIVDDNVYVEEINFALTSYELWTGEIDESHPDSMVVGVSVTYTDGSTDSDAYTISIATGGESYVSYDETTKTLSAVSEGTTQITATSTDQMKDGSNATATVGVTVSHNTVLVNEIHFSSPTWEVKEEESFTIGPSGLDQELDVTVTTGPDNADERSWELSTEDTNIEIGTPDGNGVYTVTASALSESGVTESASITVTPKSGKEGVSDTLGISILPYDSDITYVSSITLNPTTKTIDEGEEFTIGTGEVGVAVTVEPEDATDPSYTVSCENDLISVTGSGDSWTIKAEEGAGGEEAGGQTYDVVVTANDGSGKSSTLALTVNRPESVPKEITVTGGESLELTSHNVADESDADSIDLRSTLTVTVTDQYGETYEGEGGSEYTLSTSDTGLITLDETTGVVTAVAGASGTATVTVTSVAKVDDTPLTTTVDITVTPKVYAVESISVEPSSATVDWGESTTATVSITPVYADDTTYTVTSDKTESEKLFDFEISESTITFTHKETHSGTETFTISANGGEGQECAIALTANPEILEPQSASFDGIATTLEKGTEITDLTGNYLVVNFDEAGHNTGDYVDDSVTVTYASNNTDAITVTEDGATLNCVGNGQATITATIKAEHLDEPIYAYITITVVTSMTGITLNTTSLTLDVIENPEAQLSVTFVPEDTTDAKDVTWESNATNIATVENGLVTAVGVGSAEITATCGEFTATCNVTVTRPALESYTINFTINGYSGSALGSKEGITVYGAGDFDVNGNDWVVHPLTDNNAGVFTLSLTTLPENGKSVNLYASETGSSDDMWATQLCSYTFSTTGDEYGAVVINETVTVTHSGWNTWDDIFPEHTDTEFYITLWYKNSSNDSSNVTTLASGANYFSGSDTSGVTTKTASSSHQTYQYNTTAGKATESTGYSSWFTFHDGSWNYEHGCGTVSIASSSSGYSVYVAETDGTYTYVAWEDLEVYGVVDGWATNVADLETFANTLSGFGTLG